jgi:alkylhydroperoxidase family enzyme
MRPPKQPQRAEVLPEDRVYWDRAVRRRTGDPVPETFDLGTYFGALMASPPMCAIASEMGIFFRNGGNRPHTYTHAHRELIDQVFAADWKTNVVAHLHIQDAISTGVPMKTIKALRYGHEEDLNEEETLLVKYIRQVVSGTVDDETYAKVEAVMGSERGMVEYTGFILWLNWIMRMMQALNTGTHTDAEIDKLIADIESGAIKVADYRIGTSTPMSRFDR